MKSLNLILTLTITMICCVHAVAMDKKKSKSMSEELLVEPGSQEGKVVYVNCQSSARHEWLNFSVNYFKQETRFNIKIENGAFAFPSPKLAGTRTLFVIDDPTLPTIVCAPEDGWVAVNVAKLKCEKPSFYEARVKKELSRGFAYLCGAVNSQYNGSLLDGITTIKQLDRHYDHRLPVDIFGRMKRSMEICGVTPGNTATYYEACQQGWAPQPTNEQQKAIWEKVHTPPSKPIKITYDKDRQKPVVK